MDENKALEQRIVRYLDACAPGISGRGGHSQTFSVACSLVNGFALDEETARARLDSELAPPPIVVSEAEITAQTPDPLFDSKGIYTSATRRLIPHKVLLPLD